MKKSIPATLGALFLAAVPAWAQTVTRGPYLQQGTSTSVIVRWRTDTAANSSVRYGISPGSLTLHADNATSTTEHEVKLTGLSPGTKYYYSIGTPTRTLAGDATYFFVTAPPPGTVKPTRIWVIGDAGTKDNNQRAVRDAYTSYAGSTYTDLWLMLGDNAYNDGTDAEYQAAVFDMYATLLRQSVVWSTYGNHDGHSADSATQSGPYYNIFSFPKNGECGGLASGTEAYYSFDYANIHFICLDSYETSRAVGSA
ncbi:MAG: fibronectin type III domain-containing protein, partial [Planctomycetota bacterium]